MFIKVNGDDEDVSAAKIIGRPPHTVYRWARQGAFPPGVVIRFGRSLVFNDERLRGWLASGGTAEREADTAA